MQALQKFWVNGVSPNIWSAKDSIEGFYNNRVSPAVQLAKGSIVKFCQPANNFYNRLIETHIKAKFNNVQKYNFINSTFLALILTCQVFICFSTIATLLSSDIISGFVPIGIFALNPFVLPVVSLVLGLMFVYIVMIKGASPAADLSPATEQVEVKGTSESRGSLANVQKRLIIKVIIGSALLLVITSTYASMTASITANVVVLCGIFAITINPYIWAMLAFVSALAVIAYCRKGQ